MAHPEMVATHMLMILILTHMGSSCIQTSKPKSCATAELIVSGSVTYSNSQRTVGSTAYYTCNVGFYIQGEATRTCQSSQTWSGNIPQCLKIYCDMISAPNNGYVTYSSAENSKVAYGGTATFSCEQGYVVRGHTQITCSGTSATGTWSSSPPVCAVSVTCDPPGTLEHGQVTGNNYTEGQNVSFTCDANFGLQGDNYAKCQSDRTWSPFPQCTEKRYDCNKTSPCNPLVVPDKTLYRYVTDDKYVQCNSGYCYVQPCGSPLVYNPVTQQCDWPPAK